MLNLSFVSCLVPRRHCFLSGKDGNKENMASSWINSTALKSTAYKTLVRPTLEYACTVWDPYTQGNIYKLEMVQRRSAKFVLGRYNNTSSVRDMLYELGWTSLQTRRQTLRLCMMYKIHKGLVAMDAQEFMTPLQRRSRHVNSNAYKIPRSKTDYQMYSQERYESGTAWPMKQ